MSGATTPDLPNWLAQQKAKNAADGLLPPPSASRMTGIGNDNLLTPPPAANRPAWWDNPVGAERLDDTYASPASANFSPLVDRRYASRPLTQAEADWIETGAHDYSLSLFGNLALAEVPDLGPPGAPRRIVAASVRPPGPYPRPPTPATNALNPASADMAPIRAYHGSPYDFNAFDTSKIGTGEGVQAYGYGHYAADNPSVADTYREGSAPPAFNETKSGVPISPTLSRMLQDGWYDARSQGVFPTTVDHAVAATEANLTRQRAQAAKVGDFDWHNSVSDQLAELGRMGNDPPKGPGHLYELNIHADPEHFLDWDKPLSEQSQHVQDALSDWNASRHSDERLPARVYGKTPSELVEPSGAGVYKHFSGVSGNDPAAGAKSLHAAGIPGIKYLDQGSRSSGQGTSNYVIFDPKTIEILRKYGLAGLMAGGAAAVTSDNQ